MDQHKALKILSVSRKAGPDEIHRAFKRIVRIWFPLRTSKDDNIRSQAVQQLDEATRAYGIATGSDIPAKRPATKLAADPPAAGGNGPQPGQAGPGRTPDADAAEKAAAVSGAHPGKKISKKRPSKTKKSVGGHGGSKKR